MQLFHATLSELKDSTPLVQPFVGQMIAVYVSWTSTELFTVTRIVEKDDIQVVYSNPLNTICRTFSRAQWGMMEVRLSLESFAKQHYPEPSAVDGAFYCEPIDIDGMTARLYHRVNRLKRKNELVLVRDPVTHHLIDGVVNAMFSVEVLSGWFLCPKEFLTSTEYRTHLSVLKARFRQWWIDKVHPLKQLPLPHKKLPTPFGVDVASGPDKTVYRVFDVDGFREFSTLEEAIKFTGTKDHKIVQGVGPLDYRTTEPINCRCELQSGNVVLKSLDEWDNPMQPVEDKSEGDAMMEFFKGGK